MQQPRTALSRSTRTALVASVAAAALCAGPAFALYKVIGPDGKVTYTDRPPATAAGDRVTPLGAGGAAPAASVLPLELRQANARYPVTLYVSSNCDVCDAGRALLRQRGVPYSERQIVTSDDSDALQRLTGGRIAPTLTIGSQALKGLSAELWNNYLDSAGYPRESKLPSNYSFAPATPLTERREAGRPAAVVPARSAASAPTEPIDNADPTPTRIKF